MEAFSWSPSYLSSRDFHPDGLEVLEGCGGHHPGGLNDSVNSGSTMDSQETRLPQTPTSARSGSTRAPISPPLPGAEAAESSAGSEWRAPPPEPQRFSLSSFDADAPDSDSEGSTQETAVHMYAMPSTHSDRQMHWAQKAWHCSVCASVLGKRHMRPRHHCRVCGASVCSSCSRSQLQLQGRGSQPQRACVSCVSVAMKSSTLQKRLNILGKRLSTLNSVSGGSQPMQAPVFGNCEEAVTFCEAALQELEKSLAVCDLTGAGRAACNQAHHDAGPAGVPPGHR